MDFADSCRVLGVSRHDTIQTATKAYRKLALTCHPDRVGPAGTAQFQELSAAYEKFKEVQELKNTSDQPSKQSDAEKTPSTPHPQSKSTADSRGSTSRPEPGKGTTRPDSSSNDNRNSNAGNWTPKPKTTKHARFADDNEPASSAGSSTQQAKPSNNSSRDSSFRERPNSSRKHESTSTAEHPKRPPPAAQPNSPPKDHRNGIPFDVNGSLEGYNPRAEMICICVPPRLAGYCEKADLNQQINTIRHYLSKWVIDRLDVYMESGIHINMVDKLPFSRVDVSKHRTKWSLAESKSIQLDWDTCLVIKLLRNNLEKCNSIDLVRRVCRRIGEILNAIKWTRFTSASLIRGPEQFERFRYLSYPMNMADILVQELRTIVHAPSDACEFCNGLVPILNEGWFEADKKWRSRLRLPVIEDYSLLSNIKIIPNKCIGVSASYFRQDTACYQMLRSRPGT